MKRITAILTIHFVLSANWTSAQPEVEVIVQSARMRRGPSLTYAVQHYANSGHGLKVLETNATTDPPWTWYFTETPSGARAWIRADLVRRLATTMSVGVRNATVVRQEQQNVDSNPNNNPFPVVSNNLCNTPLFRSCRDGSEHTLWEAGYWAKDRYDKWQRDGVNLHIAFTMNACRTSQICPSWEAWELGRQAAVRIYPPPSASVPAATPPKQTDEESRKDDDKKEKEIEPLNVNWLALVGEEIGGLPWTGYSEITHLFNPPYEVKDGATILGRFKYNGETVRFTCQFWHNAGRDATDFALVGPKTISSFPADGDLKCLDNHIAEAQVMASQWYIKIERRYGSEGAVRNVKWTLEGTYGVKPVAACVGSDRLHDTTGPCVKEVVEALLTYLSGHKDRNAKKPMNPGVPGFIASPGTATCHGTKNARNSQPGKEVTDYRHQCRYQTENGFDLTLTFHVTRANQDRGLKPKE